MSTTPNRTQGTSTDDLIRRETASTSTSHFVTSSDAAIQTEDQEFQDSCSADSEWEISDEELGARAAARDEAEERTLRKLGARAAARDEAEERTLRKRLMLPGEENANDEEETAASRPVLSTEEGGRTCVRVGERNGETTVDEISLPAAVDKVEIVQEQRTIHNNNIVENFHFNWNNFNEEIVSERISAAQQKTERKVQSMERRLRKEMKESKALTKQLYQRQLLQSHASDVALKEQLRAEMAQQREEFARKQEELVELQRQTLDQLAQLAVDQEDARRREKEAKSFVFKLGEKQARIMERIWTEVQESQFVQLMKRLYQKFKIKVRQVGINCGIRFVVDVPPEHAEALAEQQAAIQETIAEEILPEEFQEEVTWEPAVPVSGEAETPPVQVLGGAELNPPVQVLEGAELNPPVQVLGGAELNPPVQISDAQEELSADVVSTDGQQMLVQTPPASEPVQTFDPMTAIPELSCELDVTDDTCAAVSSLVITSSKLVVLADFDSKKVVCMPLDSPRAPFASTCLHVQPCDMNEYERDVIAVVSNTDVIFMLGVRKDAVVVVRQVTTQRNYSGVTSFGDGDVLVVSTLKDELGPAAVDVITGKGNWLWTVADKLPDLQWPFSLCMRQREVLIADRCGVIHRVDVIERRSYPALSHQHLIGLGQIAADPEGNVYMTSCHPSCVLVHSVSSAQWRVLLTQRQDEDPDTDTPWAVGVTENGVMLLSMDCALSRGRPVLRRYNFKSRTGGVTELTGSRKSSVGTAPDS